MTPQKGGTWDIAFIPAQLHKSVALLSYYPKILFTLKLLEMSFSSH